MSEQEHKRGYWPKERCLEEAKKCTSRMEFKKNSPTAYNVSCQQGWLDAICNHMKSTQKPHGYWTKKKMHRRSL